MQPEDIKALAQQSAFRALTPEDQVRALRGTRVERTFTVDRNADIDKEKRTCWFSIASDAPYERWWGVEILDMAKTSIRDERLKNGLPFCVDHDTRDIVGKAFEFEITAAKKLRLHVRFGKSARAEEIWQDVLDDIRTDTSVGYVIHDLVLVREKDGVSTYRVTDWEPLEGSLVAVPADPTVGLGRAFVPPTPAAPEPAAPAATPSQILRSNEMNPDEIKAAQEKVAAEAATRAIATEQKRVSDLLKLGDEYKDAELARELVADPAATVADFNRRKLEKMRTAPAPMPLAEPAAGPAFGEAARTILRYKPLGAFKDQVQKDGKVMKAEEAAYRAGQWMAATIYGRESAAKWCRDNSVPMTRVMSGNSLSAGGALIPIEMENAIIDLRDMYGAARQLCRVRPMSSDALDVPKRVSGVTAYFFGDDDGAGLTASDKGWGNVRLTAKKLGALTRVSKDLIDDAVINVVDDLAQEFGYAFAVKEDQCWIDGDGTSTYGNISGFRGLFVATAFASRITLATNHDLMSEVDATDLGNVMAGLAAYARPGAKWLCSNAFKSAVFDRLKASAGGNDVNTLGQPTGDRYLGYPIVTSEAMPSDTTTDFTSLVMATFGDFTKATSIGSRRGIEVQVLNERYAELGQIGVVGTERFDIVTHDLGSTTVRGPVAAAYGA